MKINTKFKKWIVNNNFTNYYVAKELGINKDYLSTIVSGSQMPSPKLAKKIKELTKGEVGYDSLFENLISTRQQPQEDN